MPFCETQLHYMPETVWREGYERTEVSPAVRKVAEACLQGAQRLAGPTEEDVMNGVRCYVAARRLLEAEIPPAGGCVVAPMVRLDGGFDVLDVPGHHQLLFYGNRRRELLAFCNLFGIQPILPETG